MARIASATGVPCATRTSTWRSLEMISSGVCLFLPIVILLWLRSHTSGWTTPTGRSVERSAGFFHEAVEPGSDQHLLQAVVEHVARGARHLGPHHHQLALTIALPPHRHSQTPTRSLARSSQTAPTSSTGC